MIHGLKVVIVDDDASLCYTLRDVLESSEIFEVIGIAFNGQEAIDLIEREEPDIVILDIIMPKLDGLDVLKHFNKNKAIDFVILSALEHDLITRKAIELGAMYYLMKPFESSDFMEKMIALFSGKKAKSRACKVESTLYYREIEKILTSLGVPRHLKGYSYLYHGIFDIILAEGQGFKITKEIYPQLAKRFNTTTSSVEKAIRSVVALTLKRGDKEFLKSYFSKELFNDKITNKAFMMKIAAEVSKIV